MNRGKEIIKYSTLGIILNIILVIFKAVVGLLSGSIAVISDAFNNLGDALSSIAVIIGIKLSEKPADREHPFGHGRVEYFSSIIVSIIIIVSGLGVFKESVVKIINPSTVSYSIISLIIIFATVLVKYIYGNNMKKIGKKLNSTSLVASGSDAYMDSILSFSVFISALITMIFNINLEAYLGIIISLLIIKTGIDILKTTINSILGERTSKDITISLRNKINSYKEVLGTYDIILHNYGPSNIIGSVHIEVKGDMTALEVHKLTRDIITDIYNEFGIILTIGIYAYNDDDKYKEIKDYIDSIINTYNDILELHGFYVDEDNNNISFDIVTSFNVKDEELLKKEIINKLKKKYKEYNYTIIIDRDISD